MRDKLRDYTALELIRLARSLTTDGFTDDYLASAEEQQVRRNMEYEDDR